MRTLATLTLLLLTSAVPSLAQTKRPLGLLVGGGLEILTIRDGSQWTPHATLLTGLQFQPRGSRWGARATASVFDDRDGVRTQSLGLAFEATRDLGGNTLHPYLLGGGGASWLYGPGVWRWSGLATVGAGVENRILGARVFLEARYQHYTSGHGWASHLIPVTIGFRL